MSKEILYNNVTIGADPEFFLKDKKTGKFISAIGLVGGTKDEPIPISDNGHGLQEDNVSVEATMPPSRTREELIENINFVKDYIKKVVGDPRGLELTFCASARFEEDQLDNPIAQEFGCSPDFCVWTEDVNPRPDSNTNMRTTSGHVHFGYDNPTEQKSVEIVKAADLFLGLPSLLLDPDRERRQMYGKAGSFRFKPYGVETRILSNFWLKDENSITWLYNQAQLMFKFLNEGNTISGEDGIAIAECINSYNIKLAKQLIKKYNIECVES
jgi:hypothetical protein